MVEGIIFDIDGIIIDSEELHGKALYEAIKCVMGKEVNIDAKNLLGLSLDETILRFGFTDMQLNKIKNYTTNYYLENVIYCQIREGIELFLQKIIEKNMKFGFVSSAHLIICKANISRLNLKLSNIPIVGFESVSKTKPDPMPYLKMLDILGLDANKIIVLEDSDTGIDSAYQAGIRNIYAWPHKLSYTQKYNNAKMIIQTLDEIHLRAGI